MNDEERIATRAYFLWENQTGRDWAADASNWAEAADFESALPRCAYCGKRHEDPTDEHVVPQGLGGAVTPTNPFLLRTVCGRCNSAAGRHIDGPFIRSWFMTNSGFITKFRYLDPSSGLPIRPAYGGEFKAAFTHAPPDVVCDFWLGAAGDSIFHFHKPYPSALAQVIAGRPLDVLPTQLDPGFVFVWIRGSNPVWHPPTLRGVAEAFKDAEIHVVNSNVHQGNFIPVPPARQALANECQTLLQSGSGLSLGFGASADFGERQLAKLALGFGALRLDPEFLTSPDAVELRNFMWARSSAQRANLGVHGTGFLGQQRGVVVDSLAWEPGHIFVVMPANQDELMLVPMFYGSHSAAIRITSNRSHWAGRIPSDGEVWAVAPTFRAAAGPIPLPAYVAARQGIRTGAAADFHALDDRAQALPPPPPF